MAILKNGKDGSTIRLPRRCLHCAELFGKNEPSWFWVGTSVIRMHLTCWLDWVRRTQRDIERATSILAEENK